MARSQLYALSMTWLLAAGCSKAVTFQGERTLSVAGTPPAPVAQVPPPRVEVRDNKIEIREKVQFEYDKATILPVSFSLLDEVASVIRQHPQLKKIRVEGHASAEGSARHNQKLSEARAAAVRDYLVGKGIAPALLISQGFGIDQPIADNATPEGREQNRRVEFEILEQDVTTKTVEIDHTGKEKVIDQKTATPAPTATPAAMPGGRS